MASNEFVDLDEIVPGTGFSKKQDEPAKKKEQPQKKESTEPSIEVYGDDEGSSSAGSEEKKPEEKKKQKEEAKSKEDLPIFEDKPKPIASNGKKEKIIQSKETILNSKQDKLKEAEVKKQVSKATFTQIVSKKRDLKKTKPVQEKEHKKVSRVISSKKEKKEKRKEVKETNWTLVALLILAAIIIGVIIYVALKFDFTKSAEQESVVAVVNGQPIYKSELMNRYNLLKSTANPFITEEQVLNLTIMDKLLLQEAEKKGISTTDEEVNVLIKDIMAQNNIDEESLKKDLSAKNVSYDFLIKMYKGTLTINKLINESFSNLTISNEELKEFYEENKESLKVPDMVQARHILFLFGNESEKDTLARAEVVLNMLKSDKSNFCDLGAKYNGDIASIGFCGEYNFSMDYPFVPEFLEAGFSMNPGEIRVVKTQLGYHIMYKVDDLPGYVPELKDIKSQLEPVLIREKTISELDLLIEDLKKEAIIEIYSENITAKRFSEISVAKEEVPEVFSDDEVEEEVSVEPPVSEVETSEVIDVEIPVQTEITKEIVSTPKSQKMILANCLNDKGVRMFTASWSPDSQDQLALFGDYASSLKIVECDPEAANADLAECSKVLQKKYPTWPTWQMGETLYEGIQSLSALSKYSGCPY